MLPEIGDYARNWKKLEGDKNTELALTQISQTSINSLRMSFSSK
jgi:hypothetical protein